MKNLKYFFLMAVPVLLLSCGQSNTQNRANKNEGGMGSRDKDYQNVQRNDQDRSVIKTDTSKYRSGSQGSGMGSQGSSTQQGSRSGSQSGTQEGSSTQQGSRSSSQTGTQGTSTHQGTVVDTSKNQSSSTNRSTNRSSTPVNR